MQEQWKDIPGYEGLYQASNTGLIRSAEGKTTSNARYSVRVWRMRILKPKKRKRTTGTYDPRVDLWKDGNHKSFLVSRLVAMTWCDGYSAELTVNHKDGDTLNNNPTNLEWISRTENIRKGYVTGLYDNARKKCTLTDSEQHSYAFDSLSEASIFLGRCNKYVSDRLTCHKANAISKDGVVYVITVQ